MIKKIEKIVFRLNDDSKRVLETADPAIKQAVERYLKRLNSNPVTPDETVSYDEMAKALREAGWVTLWSDDNWVKEEWFGHPTIDIDRAGSSTIQAYRKIVNTVE